MISLTIDGIRVDVEEGATILEAARKAGVEIPTLCHDDRLVPYGACRMCMVEVKGNAKLLPACTSPAAKEMEVTTNSERLQKIRRTILEMQCVNHPLDCPVCDAAGECNLQDLVYAHGLQENRFKLERRDDPPDSRSPLVERNPNRCIFCSRCVRICLEVQGVGAIGLVNRGFGTLVGPAFGEPLDCEFCGQCIATCPVGALSSKIFKFRSRSWFLTRTASTCPHCGTGCRIGVEHRDGKVFRITGRVGEGVNNGNLCPKGRFGYEFVNSDDRLAKPRVKKDGVPADVSWDEALDTAAKGLKRVLDAGGPDAVAFLGSGRLTNEENYLLQKLARAGAGTNNVDTLARFGHARAVALARKAFGGPAPAPTYDAIAAAKTIVLVDSVVTETNPVIGNHVLKARARGAKVVLLSPRGSKIVRHADLWIQHRPATAAAVLLGAANAWIYGTGSPPAAKAVEGYEAFAAAVKDTTPAAAAELSGADEAAVRELARILAEEGPALFVVGMPSYENVKGANTWSAAFDLSLLAGATAKGTLGVLTPTEACNTQGALDMGAAPEWLPGLQPVSDEAARKAFAEAWGKPLPAKAGLDAQGMIEAAENGRLKALVVAGENPVFNAPDSERVKKALAKLDFLVVLDPFLTETAELAHVVLPATTFAEKSGTFTNTELRIQAVHGAIAPRGESRPDCRILAELGRRLGMPGDTAGPKDVAREIAASVPALAGMTDDEALAGAGVLWAAGAGAEATPSFLEVTAVAAPAKTKDRQVLLVTGTLLNHSGTVTRHCPGLNEVVPEGWLRLHPADAKAAGLEDGDSVALRGLSANVQAKVKLDDTMMRGSGFLPLHFRGTPAFNVVTLPGAKTEKTPDAVTLERVQVKVKAGA